MTRNRTRAGPDKTSRNRTARRVPLAIRSSRNRLRMTAGLPAVEETTGTEVAGGPEVVKPRPDANAPPSAVASAAPAGVAPVREADAADGVPPLVFAAAAPAGRPGCVPVVVTPGTGTGVVVCTLVVTP